MSDGLFEKVYNPDVLSCLANLSNDEVFTPPEVVNAMLDMLPEELWRNPDAKFLDPACKTGVFLREIAKRLLKGLEKQIPDLQARVDHIFRNQLYGIAITELTALLSRRGLYCSKRPDGGYSVTRFKTPEGNIRFRRTEHTWRGGRCIHCGANESVLGGEERETELETHAYEWIHGESTEEIFNMKFDVIISNPPYQTYTNTQERVAAKQAKPLFHLFVEKAKKIGSKYVIMVIPARWYSGGIGLSEFRETMIHDRHILKLVDYPNSKECFGGVDIAGGVCYFLWDRDTETACEVTNIINGVKSTSIRNLDEFGEVVIRSNASLPILEKVRFYTEGMLDQQVLPLDPFGFSSSDRGSETPFDGCCALIHSQGVGYVPFDSVKKNADLVNKWKVIIGKIVPGNGEVGVDPEKGYKAITMPRILRPGEINTFSYVLLGTFDSELEAINFKKYMMCKFPRFLLRLTYSSMNIAKANFAFVPRVDFTEEWTDEKLYALFNISEEERELIEKTIRFFDEEDE